MWQLMKTWKDLQGLLDYYFFLINHNKICLEIHISYIHILYNLHTNRGKKLITSKLSLAVNMK